MDDIQLAAKQFGRMGGLATKTKYGLDHYRKMQAKGVQTRLKNKGPKDPLDKPL